ncbi:hypothetical protein NS220_11230 [Microbacterium testaceum]|uniref:Uncharacterized protein n=1 Tax=Microbacterium testaceum TaxID=2033 RepID=A0A147EW26_MICTE|nr:hypothetical protein [Microbacterium testaceum]KTR93805.1 hypothetical protein NS220_11230 [Microbacterium testaceum]
MTSDPEVVNLSIELGFFGDGTLVLRYPSDYESEVSSLLDAAGLDHEPVLAHTDGLGVLVEAIKALGPGSGAAGLGVFLSSLYKAIVHRNDGKRVVLDGQEIVGFSDKKIDKILRDHMKRLEERDAKETDSSDS